MARGCREVIWSASRSNLDRGRCGLLMGRDHRPQGSRGIRGSGDLFRVRAGDYRIVYRIEGETLVVLIVRIGHRRDVYRNL